MDLNELLRQVIAEAKAVKIPVSDKISPQVVINRRAKTRVGCCKKTGGGFVIELSERVVEAGETACKTVLAHEILHSCYGCMNHGVRWKSCAAKMKEAYGYDISRTTQSDELGVEKDYPVRYRFRCQSCGAIVERMRKSRFVENYKQYRCRCGGRLEKAD